MIHFVPDSPAQEMPAPYAEAVARLAGLRHALQLVEGLTGAAPVAMGDEFPQPGELSQRCFEDRSARTVAGSAAGLEAIAALRDHGLEASPAAAERLARDIRAGLEELGVHFSL
jgi:hypothetical protein